MESVDYSVQGTVFDIQRFFHSRWTRNQDNRIFERLSITM